MKKYNLNNNGILALGSLDYGTTVVKVKIGRKWYDLKIQKDKLSAFIVLDNNEVYNYLVLSPFALVDRMLLENIKEILQAQLILSRFKYKLI